MYDIICGMRPPKHRIPINLKSLPRSKREVYRQQAFAAFKAGKKAYAAAKDLNLNESCVDNWYARFRREGDAALSERKRGPASETKATLTTEEIQLLLKAVTGTTPDQLMFDFALWSSRAGWPTSPGNSRNRSADGRRAATCGASDSPTSARSDVPESRTPQPSTSG